MTEDSVAPRLLVVSRESAVLKPIWSVGQLNSWQLETVGSGWEALERVQSGLAPDLLLLDLPRGDMDSLHTLRWLRRLRPNLPVVLLGHPEDAAQKKEAIRLGAQEYIVRPIRENDLEVAIRRHLASRNNDDVETDITSEDIEQISEDVFFLGANPVMRKLRAQAELLAEANVPALILGESGSGKDTTAALIHKLSVRSGCKFLKVNCAALPEDLLETELFGYERSLSPGSVRTKPGKLELCEKGTILLDEIEETPNAIQATLAHVLQYKEFYRPGSKTVVDVDVRILAATSANIDRVLSEGKLREDLYYRLSAFTVHVPPLRQRRDELPLLLRHFMHQLAKHYGLPPRTFTPEMYTACQHYSWPGNLKELEKFVKRYLVMGDKDLDFGEPKPTSADLSRGVTHSQSAERADTASAGESDVPASSLKSLVQSVRWEAERNAIAAALEKTGWNRKAAARLLKVSYRTMLYKIEQYHMNSEAPASSFVTNGARGNGNGFRGNGK